jgi:hypothetical protein
MKITPIAAATTIAIMTISHANAQMLPNAFGEIAGQIMQQVQQYQQPPYQQPPYQQPAYQAPRAQYAWSYCNGNYNCTLNAIGQRLHTTLSQVTGTPDQQVEQICGPRPDDSDQFNANPYGYCRNQVFAHRDPIQAQQAEDALNAKIKALPARIIQQCGNEPDDGPVYGVPAGARQPGFGGTAADWVLLQDAGADWKAYRQCSKRLHEQVFGPGASAGTSSGTRWIQMH